MDLKDEILRLEKLFERGGDSGGGSPLLDARTAAGIKEALVAGADANEKDEHGNPVLHRVLFRGAFDAAERTRILLAAGADPNAAGVGGLSPLHAAAGLTDPSCAKLLLQAGADPNARDDDGCVPLHYAKKLAAVALLAAGADPTARNNDGRRPFVGEEFSRIAEVDLDVRVLDIEEVKIKNEDDKNVA